MDLSKYIPINTEEKVNALLLNILSYKSPISIEYDILQHINKLKIQMYFKDKFDAIKPLLVKIHSLPKEYIQLKRLLKNKTLNEISEIIGIPTYYIITIVLQKIPFPITLTPDSVIPVACINVCIDFFYSTYQAKKRKDKKEKELSEPYNRELIKEKFKPSYGREGNYRKLIYYGPKT